MAGEGDGNYLLCDEVVRRPLRLAFPWLQLPLDHLDALSLNVLYDILPRLVAVAAFAAAQLGEFFNIFHFLITLSRLNEWMDVLDEFGTLFTQLYWCLITVEALVHRLTRGLVEYYLAIYAALTRSLLL